MTNLEILHDHYKESFSYIRDREKQRDNLFLVQIALLGLLFLEVYQTAGIQGLLKIMEVSAAGAKLNIGELPSAVVLSVTWTVMLALTLRYCQTSISVERQYGYLHGLEEKLSSLLGDKDVYRREGKAYLAEYPLFSEWVWRFYTLVFPLIVAGSVFYLVGWELWYKSSGHYNTVYDLLIGVGVVMTLGLYRGREALDLFRSKKK